MANPAKAVLSQLKGFGGTVGDVGWVVLALLIVVGTALSSFVVIEPGQAAVKVNNLTGGQEAISRPGWTLRFPVFQSVYIVDVSPQTFRMTGDRTEDDLHVSGLTVRASDGSNFHFDDTTLVFQLNASDAVGTIKDSGPDDGFHRWMRPYARAVLRDEFGRESTLSVSDPTTYGEAANRSKERLNEVLGPHGIRVTQVVTPRPRFNDTYEKAIEDRNRLGNQLEVIKSDLDRAGTMRERSLAEVDQKKNAEIQERRAQLESVLAEAIAKQANTKRDVDTFRIEEIAKGQAALEAAKLQARELKGELAALYLSKKAEIDAFRTQPVERVMERLGEQLKGVTIEIQPYANDATPSRVQYEDIKPRGGE